MDSRYYQPISCGTPIPFDTPHAFSVSMPTYQDVVDYEEEANQIFDRIQTAYPRIVTHPLIKQCVAIYKLRLGLEGGTTFLLPSRKTAEEISTLSRTSPELFACGEESVVLAHFGPNSFDDPAPFYAFMKHCGAMVFSREAIDLLHRAGSVVPEVQESRIIDNPELRIVQVLAEGYGTSEITLCNCGMNAVWAAYRAVAQERPGREIFVQFGWLYSDSIHILRKVSHSFVQIGKVTAMDQLEELCRREGHRIAGVLTETISNPMLLTPDFVRLKALSDQYGFLIIADNTFATPWSVKLTGFCDIIVESLTKFASGHGDCMSGAVIIPEGSRIGSVGRAAIASNHIALYRADREHLAAQIGEYRSRFEQIDRNCAALVNALSGDDSLELIHLQNRSTGANFDLISTGLIEYGGILSLVPNCSFAPFYDSLNLPKGPSLGADFPLVMPYTLLAHWDLVNEAEQKTLRSIDLSPWLLRLSVGLDDPQQTIDAIRNAVRQPTM